MNLLKLSKYLAWELINKKVIEIPDFINMIENNINVIKLDKFKNKYDWITTVKDYNNLLNFIYKQSGIEPILFILKRFWLEKDFIDFIDLSTFEVWEEWDLLETKFKLLNEFNNTLEELKKSKSNKWNWNKFEDLCEKFLLHTSYFEPWFKEFNFEDWTDKIDRLLKLKKDIWNFWKNTNYLWYVILEAKYKKEETTWASEVNQLENYIKRLNKYWISKYAIVITSNDHKNTYKTKIWDYCREKVIEQNPFYLSLITVEEIKQFLENKWNYENMSFDEFIERSFIKWLK